MTATRDKFGRPIVVVTGMGVVTSLGAGKTDNWAKLCRRRIRHPHHHALSDRRPEDHDGRHGRFPAGRAVLVDRSRRSGSADIATEEAIAQAGIGSKGDFPGPAVSGGGAGRSRMAAAPGTGARRPAPTPGSITTRCCASAAAASSPTITAASCSARWPTISPTRSAPRARRFRCRRPARPAPPRSSSASKRSAAAKPMPRCASPPTARSIRKR